MFYLDNIVQNIFVKLKNLQRIFQITGIKYSKIISNLKPSNLQYDLRHNCLQNKN